MGFMHSDVLKFFLQSQTDSMVAAGSMSRSASTGSHTRATRGGRKVKEDDKEDHVSENSARCSHSQRGIPNPLDHGRRHPWVFTAFKIGVPTGIRTPVLTVKGWCPRPLDDGDAGRQLTLKSSTRESDWWSQAGSNRRPLACHASALPAELWPHTEARDVT